MPYTKTIVTCLYSRAPQVGNAGHETGYTFGTTLYAINTTFTRVFRLTCGGESKIWPFLPPLDRGDHCAL